jgi:hypothetical protein
VTEDQKPVAWCSLTIGGNIEYFDGKPMVMPGDVGNDCHKDPLYTRATLDAAIAQARREERERCAKVCDYFHAIGRIVYTPDECAAAIRALADKGAQP